VVKDPRLPNFFVLGAAKCGTTSLYHYLKQHPEIYLPKDKEPHFFDNDTFWNEGLETYLKRHFRKAGGFPARGDTTPGYFHRWRKVIPRIKKVYEKNTPKFILIFRDPVQRAWSHYLHMVRNRLEYETFERALELEAKRIRETPNRWFGYFTDGLYASQLKPWLEAFSKTNFLFLLTEDLSKRPHEVLQEIFAFLGVDRNARISTFVKANVAAEPRWESLIKFLSKPSPLKKPFKILLSPYARKRVNEWLRRANLKALTMKPIMEPETEQRLRERYAKEVRELERLINKDLSHWLPQT